MAVVVDSSLVDGDIVTLVDPATAESFDISGNPASVDQINPETDPSAQIVNPFTGEVLKYLDGVVVALDSGGETGTLTATVSALPTAAQTLQLTEKAESLIFTFEQSDGSQLVIRAAFTGGEGPTMQQVLDGYTLDDLLAVTTTLNSAPYEGTTDPDAGTDGPDDLAGGATDDTLNGGDGNDTLSGDDGDDLLVGGSGDDSASGGVGDDQIWAGSGDQGDDYFEGGAGNDSIGGGAGNDTLAGDAGNDQVWAGAGNDDVNGGGGNDSMGGGAGSDTMSGGNGDDTIYTGAGSDRVLAGAGSDSVYGGGGDDEIFGNNGTDLIFGGAGSDELDGGDGNDTLWGGAGNDTMNGGGGDDTFAFAANFGDDQIDGFADGDNTLDLSELGLTGIGDLTFTQQGSDLEIDTGSGTITLVGVTEAEINSSDFLF